MVFLTRMLASLALLLLCLIPALSNPDTRPESTEGFQILLDQLTHLKADENNSASVHALTLKRDVGTFNLEQGNIYLTAPVLGRICAAVFIGKGSFFYSPPTNIEKEQLVRFYGRDSLNEQFNFMLILFADSTLEELQSKLAFEPTDVPKYVNEDIGYSLRYFTDPGKTYIDADIAKALLEHDRNELFYAHFSREKRQPMCFEIDPYQAEEVSFMRVDNSDHDERSFETINQFHLNKECVIDNGPPPTNKWYLKPDTTAIACTINGNLSMELSSRTQFHFLRKNQSWLNFLLAPALDIDSIYSGSTRITGFSKGKDNPWLWVRYPHPSFAGEHGELTFYYHGSILKKDLDFVYIETSTFWYPRYDVTQKSVFDLTFRVPDRFTFVTEGECLSTVREEGIERSHWRTLGPIRNASFNIGYFEQKKIDFPGIPPVTVLMTSTRHGMLDEVGADIANSLNFYQNHFGRSTLTHLYVSEIPYSNGEAFPGLVHLASETFENTRSGGTDEIFRAHEAAHQWWGIGVGFRTYHDQWLSEGLSDYSALWYMQSVLKDDGKFYSRLDAWRRSIFENRKYLFKDGQAAGPIWLGYRTNSYNTPGDFDLVIYKKGAWVLHMLRSLLLNLQTMNDDAFSGLLREYYTTYLDSAASTEEFEKIVEKHAGMPMDWFFNEWVYETKIPKFEFSYNTALQADGEYKVSCRVRTSNVADNFRMPVPIRIDFGDDNFYRLRVEVCGPVTEFDLPPLPLEPKHIEFNDLHAVLCESDNVGW